MHNYILENVNKTRCTLSGKANNHMLFISIPMAHRVITKVCFSLLMLVVSVLVVGTNLGECSSFRSENKAKDKSTLKLSAPVEEGISHLLTALTVKTEEFDASKVKGLIQFVENSKPTDKLIEIPKRESASGAAMRMDIKASLARILEYTYNPEIPNYAIYPSVIRLSGWDPKSEFYADKVQPWKYLEDSDVPKVWRGKEFEVNTPDSFGGAYYRYDLNRLLVLMKYEGRNVFLSVARQDDKSSVGMKGLVMDDSQWNYFYSGIPGLTAGGMGWMDTFMYDSISVSVYIQDDKNPDDTVFYLFKWLRAGWAGLNVVRPKHIFEGSQRFASSFRGLMESKNLPEPAVFAEEVKSIEGLSDLKIDTFISEYAKSIEDLASKNPVLSDKFPEVYEDGKYADSFTREERIGILVKEYVKRAMGKQCLIYEKVVQN
ncbi:hypothetical protein [Maridesulfovibrio frigidus]|uniref:hypothetical protein n=1 Tax=Maridesulfovibrio frigidus TaxID=340956 RepID=UPI001F43160F|nr:hypothetical protein [Maridesulfovibrio frigidus]